MFFSFKNLVYIAIIGDIKDSKKIDQRSQVQNKLRLVLEEVNEKYDSEIASKFTITLGDEFQGLLSRGANTMDIITEIEMKMHPVKIRLTGMQRMHMNQTVMHMTAQSPAITKVISIKK